MAPLEALLQPAEAQHLHVSDNVSSGLVRGLQEQMEALRNENRELTEQLVAVEEELARRPAETAVAQQPAGRAVPARVLTAALAQAESELEALHVQLALQQDEFMAALGAAEERSSHIASAAAALQEAKRREASLAAELQAAHEELEGMRLRGAASARADVKAAVAEVDARRRAAAQQAERDAELARAREAGLQAELQQARGQLAQAQSQLQSLMYQMQQLAMQQQQHRPPVPPPQSEFAAYVGERRQQATVLAPPAPRRDLHDAAGGGGGGARPPSKGGAVPSSLPPLENRSAGPVGRARGDAAASVASMQAALHARWSSYVGMHGGGGNGGGGGGGGGGPPRDREAPPHHQVDHTLATILGSRGPSDTRPRRPYGR